MSTKQTIEIFSTKEKLPDDSLQFVSAKTNPTPDFPNGFWETARPCGVLPIIHSHWFCQPDTPPEPKPTAAEPPKGVDPDLMKRLGDMRLRLQNVYEHRSRGQVADAIISVEGILDQIIDTLQGLAERDANRAPVGGNLNQGQRVKLKGTNRTGIIVGKTSGGWHTVKWDDGFGEPHGYKCYEDWRLEPV